jgi:hypothetical protein
VVAGLEQYRRNKEIRLRHPLDAVDQHDITVSSAISIPGPTAAIQASACAGVGASFTPSPVIDRLFAFQLCYLIFLYSQTDEEHLLCESLGLQVRPFAEFP